MIFEETYIFIWILIAVGIFYSYVQHGKKQYSEGMSDALHMHNDGVLQYRMIRNKNGEKDIQIRIDKDKY